METCWTSLQGCIQPRDGFERCAQHKLRGEIALCYNRAVSKRKGDVLMWLPSCTMTSVLCDAVKGFCHSEGDSRNRGN